MSLSDFDPLVSPINNGGSAAAAAPSPSNASSAAAAAKQPKKFDGPAVAAAEEDPVDRIQREKAEKEKADREKAEKEREEEQARQEEARQAAAAGKEDIGADIKKVDLPGELNVGGATPDASSSASASPPIDPAIAQAQAELERLNLAHEKELAARNRYADRATFHYTSSEGSKAVDLPVVNSTELVGAFELKGQQIILSDVSKIVTKAGEEPQRTDISGTFPLSITADGKKVSGQIAGEELEFELFESDKSLEALLGF